MARNRREDKQEYGASWACALCRETPGNRHEHWFSVPMSEMTAHLREQFAGKPWLDNGGLNALVSFRHNIRDRYNGDGVFEDGSPMSAEEHWIEIARQRGERQ